MRLGSRRKHEAEVRLFFATDIHGSEQCFRKWLNAPAAYQTNVLVLGGDIVGKTLVPIVSRNGGWEAELFGSLQRAADESELESLRKSLRRVGYYDVLVSAEEKSMMDTDERTRERVFLDAIEDTTRRWMALAEERLAEGDVCYVMLGNDDPPVIADVMRGSPVAVFAEDEVVELPGGHEMISFGYSTPTPWDTPREMSEEEIETRLAELIGSLRTPERAIFNFHCPPKGSQLDLAPRLDETLKPVTGPGGAVETIPVGSSAVRAAIERHQPLLGLHGHVHECSAGVRLGRTLCINPGSDYGIGNLRGAIVELQGDDDVRRWQLTQG
jgi:uncharacterized protein